MIRPGLLTASTSKADHFGMSRDCGSVFLSMMFCSFVFMVLLFVLEREWFPLVATFGTDWRLIRHPQDRNNV
jgi:hypothetical protein